MGKDSFHSVKITILAAPVQVAREAAQNSRRGWWRKPPSLEVKSDSWVEAKTNFIVLTD